MIELKKLYKKYKIGKETFTALNNINLNIEEGSLVAVIGPSGSGKSTMMNIVGLLDKPTGGEYWLNGEEVSTLSADKLANLRNHQIGFVFQSFFLLPKLTALQNVGLPLTYRHLSTAEINRRAQSKLDLVSVGHLAKHKPAEMSGGQQQRVAIARALVTDPHIILADEPTGNLDSVTSQEVMDLLKEINQTAQTTIIIVTHDPMVAAQCSIVIKIEDGQIR